MNQHTGGMMGVPMSMQGMPPMMQHQAMMQGQQQGSMPMMQGMGHRGPQGNPGASGSNSLGGNMGMGMPMDQGMYQQQNTAHQHASNIMAAIDTKGADGIPAQPLKRKRKVDDEPNAGVAKKPAPKPSDGTKKKPRTKKRKLEEQMNELIQIDLTAIRSLPKMRNVAKKLQAYVKAQLEDKDHMKKKEETSAEADASQISRNVWKAWKQQMIYQPKQKLSASKRLAFSALCTRPAAAILLGEKSLMGRKAVFQKKMTQADLWGDALRKDLRYNNYLIVNSDVTVKYSVAKGEVTFSATWSCEK